MLASGFRQLRRGAAAMGFTVARTSNLNFGFDWHHDVRRLASEWRRPIGQCFDVGANDGTVAQTMIAAFPAARLDAFEPHPETFRRLETLANGRWRCHCIALSDETGKRTLNAFAYDKLNSLSTDAPGMRNGNAPVDRVDVHATTLDAFCKDNAIAAIDVLKVDTEGHEMAVLKGARELFAARKIQFVYAEFRDANGPNSLSEIAEFLGPFDLRFIATYTEQVNAPPDFSIVANGLFARL